MADLDSFFAKKDKKKVKGKKYTTTGEIARRLEETEKKLEHQQGLKVKTEPVKKLEESSETAPVVEEPPQKEEEEWNDFKDEADKDMTDLKITKLQIEDEEEGGGGSADDDGEKGDHGDRRDGVWKTEPSQTQQVPVHVAPVEPEEKVTRHVQNPNSSYVPPHMRNMSASPLPKSTPRRNRTAPDINNEMAFPSLSDAQAANPMGAWGKRKSNNEGFESVRHGSTRSMQEDYAAPKLSTANRFDALSDNS
ncbi:protein CDV3 homolog isoform X2 [Homarus americanus]|uniref:CDV3-like n=1 Tax=Homarus americanus TaxID=6706 RepID=A0A8J5N527_HOMAM|nr:protein CDV3 homolog isoform X2 [Homarus americanus]KAG7173653.1 CDV3-like [Homarus americanus]